MASELRGMLYLDQGIALSDDSVFDGHELSSGIYDRDEVTALYPIDAVTGLPMTDAGRLADPTVSPVAKEKIMARLRKEVGSYMPKDLTDEELFDILPPRYFTNDQVDIEACRAFLANKYKDLDSSIVAKLEAGADGNGDSGDGNDDSN